MPRDRPKLRDDAASPAPPPSGPEASRSTKALERATEEAGNGGAPNALVLSLRSCLVFVRSASEMPDAAARERNLALSRGALEAFSEWRREARTRG